VRKSCYQRPASTFFAINIFNCRENRAPGAEFQPRVLRCFRIAYNLEGILVFDIGREFGDVRFAFRGYLNRGIAWNVDGIILPEFEFTPPVFVTALPDRQIRAVSRPPAEKKPPAWKNSG